mgnify:FL=1
MVVDLTIIIAYVIILTMLDDFCTKLIGFYDNWNQASTNPAKWAHCKIRWERISDTELKSKQWYHYMGEENPYRKRWHRVKQENDAIIVENWSPDWGGHEPCCDMKFRYENDFWIGEVATDACIIRGGVVKSLVQFNGQIYKSRDQGWKKDKVIWGSDVIYEFKKSDKPIAV